MRRHNGRDKRLRERSERVVRIANGAEHGLVSGIFTRDVLKALKVPEGLHAGTVFVNACNNTDVEHHSAGGNSRGVGMIWGGGTGGVFTERL